MGGGPIIVNTGLRGRVQRLLHGDLRAADIQELFSSIRHQTGGRGLVSEITNFIAHPSRNQGAAWQEVCDAFEYLNFMLPFQRQKIITRDLPATVPAAMRANLRRIRKAILLRELRMSRPQAEEIMNRVLARQVSTGPGRLSKLDYRTQQEARVIICIMRRIVGGSLFDENDLLEDFYRALHDQQLIEPSEKQELKKAKTAISLFALTAMHNRSIVLRDGSVSTVSIIPDVRGNLASFAWCRIGGSRVAFWLFETNLSVATHCEPGVAPGAREPFIGDFELTPDSKLRRTF